MHPSLFRFAFRQENKQEEKELDSSEEEDGELDLPSGPPELLRDPNIIESLFVACKAYSTVDILGQLRPRLTPESTVVLFQNGILAVYEKLIEEVFTDVDSRPNFIFVSNNHGAYQKKNLHVVHAGMGRMRFGIVPDGRRDCERSYYNADFLESGRRLSLDDIAYPHGGDQGYHRYRSLRNTVAVLQSLTGLQTQWEPFATLQVHLRQKLVVNCVINPLTAILGCKNGELLKHEQGHHLARRLCWEAEKVFKEEAKAMVADWQAKKRVVLPDELLRDNLLGECEGVAEATAENISSMLADFQRKTGVTEIDYLNGFLVKLGKRYNAGTQVNASLVDLVKLRMAVS